jgi:uncharacterized protein
MGLGTSQLVDCLTPGRLHLIVMPTEACNFRCVYCYESFALGRMEPWVVAGLKRLLTRRAPGLRSLTLSWFGGEPLLAPDLIEDVMVHARALEASHARLAVRSDVTTNGFRLTTSIADRLLAVGVRDYQISLDGPREEHDQKRVRIGGRPTFDRIWENLLALRSRKDPFHVMIRLHVDRDNADSVPGFLEDLARAFALDPRFDLFLRPIGRLGGPRDDSLSILSNEESRVVLERLRRRAAELGLALASANGGDAICYATRANSFLIRADGRLNKCTVALDHPANQVGWMREDGTLDIDRGRTLAWARGLESGDAKTLACPLQGIGDALAAGWRQRQMSEANTAR